LTEEDFMKNCPGNSPQWLRAATVLALAAMLAACAGAPAPNAQLAVAQAAVERASGSAAAEAPLELAAARDKINRAQVAYSNKDYALARQLAEQAEADAGLAEAQARFVRAQRALEEVRSGIRQMREEMNRS
jgi:hypothetical protein